MTLKIEELDEFDGVTADMVRAWLRARRHRDAQGRARIHQGSCRRRRHLPAGLTPPGAACGCGPRSAAPNPAPRSDHENAQAIHQRRSSTHGPAERRRPPPARKGREQPVGVTVKRLVLLAL